MFDSATEVKAVDIARYYIKSELGHVLPSLEKKIADSNDIENKSEQEVFELCEALSIFYRLNSVWWVIGNPDFKWYRANVPIENIQLTGMGDTEISKLIDSPEIQKSPVKLREFLIDYYAKLGSGEDKYLVRPSGKQIALNAVLLVEDQGTLKLLDGSHRFVEHLFSDKVEVNAFIAKPTQSEERIIPVIGGGVYRNLVNVLESEQGEFEKKLIRDVAKLLSNYSGRNNEPLRRFSGLIDRTEK